MQIMIFSFISAMQFFLSGRASFLATRYLMCVSLGIADILTPQCNLSMRHDSGYDPVLQLLVHWSIGECSCNGKQS